MCEKTLDGSGYNGDKTGASDDHTLEAQPKTELSEVVDTDTRHLSSVVEQRFRKPNDSQADAGTSAEKPVNAGEHVCLECSNPITEEICDRMDGAYHCPFCGTWVDSRSFAAQPAEQKPVDGEHFYPYRTVDNALKHAEDEVEASDGWVRKTLAAEVSRLREELRHAQGLRSIMELKKRALEAEAERDQLKAEVAAVAALIDMQHADSLISVADIRKALAR